MSGLAPDQLVTVRMPAQQWERVLRMLATQRFDEVAPLFGEIQRQCQMHEMRQRADSPDGLRATFPRPVPDDYGPLPENAAQ